MEGIDEHMNGLPRTVNMNPLNKEFAKEYLDTGNGTQSVLKVFDVKNENVAGNKASRLLRNAKVQQYLENIAEKAATRIEQLMEQSENLPVALGASKDIMDRAGFKPVEKLAQVDTEGNDVKRDPIIEQRLNELFKE